jgi:hypothetical protein
MLRHLLAEPTFAVRCRMESHFPQVLVESAMSCAKSIYCDLACPFQFLSWDLGNISAQ